MNKKTQKFLVSIVPLVILLSSCSHAVQKSQLQFGIQAAQKDLWDEAIFRWKKVIQADPGSAAAHNNLAVAYEKKELWEEAKEEYEIAIKLSPKNERIESNYTKFKRAYDEKNKENDEKK